MRDFILVAMHFVRTARHVRHVMGVLFFILLSIAVIISIVEDHAFGDALYFTLITGLTVGYGDIAPVTAVGRLASVVAAFVGVILTGIYVGIATQAIAQTVKAHRLKQSREQDTGPDADPTGTSS